MEREIHTARGGGRRAAPLIAAAALLLVAGVAASQPTPAESTAIAEIRREIAALKRDYDERLERLERRLERLESGAAAAPPEAAESDLERLRAAARAAAARAEAPPTAPTAVEPTIGGERNLNRLNPEISATGVFLGTSVADGRDEFEAQEFELDVQSALDPFSRVRLTVAFRGDEVEIEEGYVTYSSLPGGLELGAGKFRQRFGPLNRQHLHALPQSDYPLVYQTFFGDEGLAQTGLSFNWLLARPWASANEITLEITDGENETAFAGEDFQDFSVLGRVKSYWDLSPATYLEWGLSGIAGKTADDGDSRIWGTDLTLAWQPPARAKYRGLTWRTELLRSERDDAAGVRFEAGGLYSYLEALVARNLSVGLRYDRVEDPLDPARESEGVVPYVSWWQSEYVRLRGEYRHLEDRTTGATDNRFTLQLTWAAGPHKHESY